jgi:hypothetical protein
VIRYATVLESPALVDFTEKDAPTETAETYGEPGVPPGVWMVRKIRLPDVTDVADTTTALVPFNVAVPVTGSGRYAWNAVPDDTGTRDDSDWVDPPAYGRKKLNAAGGPVMPENVTPHVHPAGSGPVLSVASSDTVGSDPARNDAITGSWETISTPASVSTALGTNDAVPDTG